MMLKKKIEKFQLSLWIEKILEMIYPKKCGFCNQRIKEDYTCQKCKKNLEYICIKEPIPQTKIDYFDLCLCAYSYQDIVRARLLEFKFKNKKYLYRALTERLLEILLPYQREINLVLCVPISWKRYFERGYNQADLIAHWIASKLQIPYDKWILLKKKNNLKQSTLNQEERIKNVIGAYQVLQKEKIQGKTILLVDDIFTTGATVNECSKILKESGAKKIIIATIAKSEIHNVYQKRKCR